MLEYKILLSEADHYSFEAHHAYLNMIITKVLKVGRCTVAIEKSEKI